MIKSFFKFAFLVSPVAGLVSCLFDSTGSSGEKAWFDSNGLPYSYQVKTLDIQGLAPLSVGVGFDSTPTIQSNRVALGSAEGVDQSLLFDFAFRDETFLTNARATGDSGLAHLTLHLDSAFYAGVGASRMPLNEELKLRYSWKIDRGLGATFLDSIGDITDSAWVQSVKTSQWVQDSADTVFSLASAVARDSIALPIPALLVHAILGATDAQHLQLKVTWLESSQILRFRSLKWNSYSIPLLKLKADTVSKDVYAFRLAQQTQLLETSCADCLVLHGGIRESLDVVFDATPLLNALAEFYQDQYPLQNQADVRQAVVMAELSIPRTSSLEGNELGHPIPLFASSWLDSLQGDGSYSLYSESYKLDTTSIKTNGHPNLVFFPGDSLKIQVTGALRHFINTAGLQSPQFKVSLRMGRPMLAPYSVYYYDHYDSVGDLVTIFADNSAFSRFDFSTNLSVGAPVRLKLWLSSVRGGEQ